MIPFYSTAIQFDIENNKDSFNSLDRLYIAWMQ